MHYSTILCYWRSKAFVDLCKYTRNKHIDEAKIEAAIPEIMNLSPKGIREKLQLNKAIYEQTAAYGHFGRKHDSGTGAFSWEALDLVSDFKSLA